MIEFQNWRSKKATNMYFPGKIIFTLALFHTEKGISVTPVSILPVSSKEGMTTNHERAQPRATGAPKAWDVVCRLQRATSLRGFGAPVSCSVTSCTTQRKSEQEAPCVTTRVLEELEASVTHSHRAINRRAASQADVQPHANTLFTSVPVLDTSSLAVKSITGMLEARRPRTEEIRKAAEPDPGMTH